MEKELLTLIDKNRDAIATNRGFYYQYLNVLQKWINNYVNGKDVDTATEVEDDIKEVGDELIFTQIKCYSSYFSFTSPEIQKALLNFFALYIKYHDQVDKLSFNFTTNASLAKNEKLLNRWISEKQTEDTELLNLCSSKVSQILLAEIKKIRDQRLSKQKLSLAGKEKLKQDFEKLNAIVRNSILLEDFVSKIHWEFGDTDPEVAVKEMEIQITEQLAHPVFEGRPVKLLLEAMLSEIYRRSQMDDKNQRSMNNATLRKIIETKDGEIYSYIDTRLIKLFTTRIDILEHDVNVIKNVLDEAVSTQIQHGDLLEKLVQNTISGKITVPHLITKIPFIDPSDVIGRAEILTDLHKLLLLARHVSIDGEGGIGKSSLLKLYVNNNKDEYDHIVWLNAESGLVNSIIINPELADNIGAPALDPEKFPERFDLVVGKINQISGHNLLIVDGYSKIEPQLEELKSLQNWQILVGTRMRLVGWKQLSVGALSFDSAKTLYHSFGDQKNITEAQLKVLFDLVGYNTLIIALVARTIYYSFDLTLDLVLSHFEEKSLDDENLQIELPDEYGESHHLLNILNRTFDLSKIELLDRYFMGFFAVLPLEDTSFNDLIDWFGKPAEKKNRPVFTNVINKLHAKGLIERSGQQISMHKMLRDSILYQERKEINPFIGQVQNVICLTMRIKEGADHSLSEALRFLKYGESILSNIKEPYRRSIYQPLLQLENEVLNIYNWVRTENNMVLKWKDLYDRAEKSLAPKDGLLGTISNNYGLALAADGNLTDAFTQFEKAISILKSLDAKALPQLLTSLCNLCHLFVQQKDISRFKECFDTMQDIRTKHNVWNDVSLPIQSHVLGVANQELGDFSKAIGFFNMAINLHQELPKESKNDAYLVYYLIKLSESYLLNKELDKAEKIIITATKVLSNLKADGLVHLQAIIRLMINISELKGDHQNAEKLKKTLDEMR
jgi:tetratricopeptide (TPR) repeat protein